MLLLKNILRAFDPSESRRRREAQDKRKEEQIEEEIRNQRYTLAYSKVAARYEAAGISPPPMHSLSSSSPLNDITSSNQQENSRIAIIGGDKKR
jgi:hypothetical protein